VVDAEELLKLGQAVDRIARHTKKLAATLRRLTSAPPSKRSAGRPTRKK
jgi:hypothetical protein